MAEASPTDQLIPQRDRFNAMLANLSDFIRWRDMPHIRKGPKTDFGVSETLVRYGVAVSWCYGRSTQFSNC
jgi:hypothetical protein